MPKRKRTEDNSDQDETDLPSHSSGSNSADDDSNQSSASGEFSYFLEICDQNRLFAQNTFRTATGTLCECLAPVFPVVGSLGIPTPPRIV